MGRDDSHGYPSMERRDYLKYLGASGALATLAGCSSSDQSGSVSGGDTADGQTGDSPTEQSASEDSTFIIGQNTGMSGDEPMDPHRATRIGTQEVLFSMHEPLFRINPDLEPVPHLAKEYEQKNGAKEYQITLEEGITFHDGSELTAEVAKWNIDRHFEESPNAYLVGDIAETEVTGEYEFVIRYDEPFPLLLQGLTDWSTGLVSKKAAEEAGDKYGQSTVVGTGPYKFTEWSRGSHIVVDRFEEYNWGPEWVQNRGPGKVATFRFESHPEPTTLLNELTDGDVHISKSILLSDAKKVENNANTNLKRKPFTRQAYLCHNTESSVMADAALRKAVNHAINKEAVIQAALGGEGYKIWALMPPASKGALSEEHARETGQPFNQSKARQLLDEAGWTNSAEGEVRSKDGKKLKIDFLTFNIPREKKVGTTIQPMLDQVGFKTNLKILEAGTLYNKLEAGEHDICVMGYGGQFAVQTLSATLTSSQSAAEGGTNFSLWSNDEFDSLIKKAKTAPAAEERQQALTDAQLVVQEQAPVAPILGYNKILGYKKSVKGIDTMTSEHPWWPVKEYLRHLELSV